MQLEARKYLFDIKQAADLIAAFSGGKSFADYGQDAMLRSAIERQFEIVGEAVSQLARLDPVLAGRLTEYRRIIAFRNILIHGYADLDQRLVWDIVQTRLGVLTEDVEGLLAQPDAKPDNSYFTR